ncbi:MAG TPA: hypothetical protein DD706_10275 [Nitrospiraceae bacterium]|nr:hypothetical protein [Nitrospiraceae bacterium]
MSSPYFPTRNGKNFTITIPLRNRNRPFLGNSCYLQIQEFGVCYASQKRAKDFGHFVSRSNQKFNGMGWTGVFSRISGG